MTGVDIDDMAAGPEMDALVAEHVTNKQYYRAEHKFFKNRFVFKWIPMDNWSPWVREQFDEGNYGEWEFCGPAYSADISAAWTLVEKFGLALIPQSSGIEGKFRWFACDVDTVIYRGNETAIVPVDGTEHSAETAPLVICRAVLSAVRAKMRLEAKKK
jgi:hypothetical protein